jgi:hypothetical protein
MDSKTVRYGRIGEVVVLIFPDESGSKHFITQLETQNLLKKMGMDKMPVRTVDSKLKPRMVA